MRARLEDLRDVRVVVWSSTSDLIGRKRMYMCDLGIGAVLYFLLASRAR